MDNNLYPYRMGPLYGLVTAMLIPAVVLQEFYWHLHPLAILAFIFILGAMLYYTLREYRLAVETGGHEGGHGPRQAAHLVMLAVFMLMAFGVIKVLYAFTAGQKFMFTNPVLELGPVLPVDPDLVWYALGVICIAIVIIIAHRFPGIRFDFHLKVRFNRWDALILLGLGLLTWAGLGTYSHFKAGTHPPMDIFGITLADHGPVLFWSAGVFFAVINSLIEEFWYRGILLGSLKPLMSPVRAVVIHALVFGLLHWFGTPQGILGVVLAGAWGGLLGWWTIKRGSLWPAVIVHFLADFLIFVYTG